MDPIREALKGVVEDILAGILGCGAAAALLDVALRTLRRYLQHYRQAGPEGLQDRRGGSPPRLTGAQEAAIVEAKRAGPHRFARKLRDLLRLPVSREAVRQVLVRYGLNRLGQPSVKPVQRFVAAALNGLWQIDSMGKVRFPLLGDLYLILALGDHSRFILAGGSFPGSSGSTSSPSCTRPSSAGGRPRRSSRIGRASSNPPTRSARPTTSTARAGSGSNSCTPTGPGPRGRSSGSSGSRDFVLEHLEAPSVAAVIAAFAQWVEVYNFGHASQALDGETPAAHCVPSPGRLTPAELELLLVHEEPRKVARTATISYYGRHYRVSDPYIGRRVWTRLKWDRLTIQVGRTTLAEYPLDYEPRTWGAAATRAARPTG